MVREAILNAAPRHAHLFEFESDFVRTLRCIPMAVRFKLDRTGIKLTLKQWSRFTQEDRRELLHMPCEGSDAVLAYRQRLVELVRRRTAEDARELSEPMDESWRDPIPPAQVLDFAQSQSVHTPSEIEWQRLNELQRFTLVKLSRDNHDNVNFAPALFEFGLGDVSKAAPRHQPAGSPRRRA